MTKVQLDTGTELPTNFKITDEFESLLQLLEHTNKNIFITGKAGSGKSTLLEYFRINSKKNLVILAPTGVAAMKVRGQTIHSFFKFPPRLILDQDIKVIRRSQKIMKQIDCCLIDEASMIRADVIDAIDKSFKINRANNEPFGGVQMVLIGDLFQLPPVIPKSDKVIFNDIYPNGAYFFNSKIFHSNPMDVFELTRVFRQREEKFINFLNKMRVSKISSEDLNMINQRVVNARDHIPRGTLILTTRNARADQINNQNLSKLDGELFEYRAGISGEFTDTPVEKLLRLKVGAQIMITKNDPEHRWVNGTLGIVRKLEKDSIIIDINGHFHEIHRESWSRYSYTSPDNPLEPSIVATFKQYPIKLAWAATIHKCQGQTFQNVAIDLHGGAFEHGQCYVALSRATSLDGIFLLGKIRRSDVIFDKRIYEYIGSKIEKKYIDEIIKNNNRNIKKYQGGSTGLVQQSKKIYPKNKPPKSLLIHIKNICKKEFFVDIVAIQSGAFFNFVEEDADYTQKHLALKNIGINFSQTGVPVSSLNLLIKQLISLNVIFCILERSGGTDNHIERTINHSNIANAIGWSIETPTTTKGKSSKIEKKYIDEIIKNNNKNIDNLVQKNKSTPNMKEPTKDYGNVLNTNRSTHQQKSTNSKVSSYHERLNQIKVKHPNAYEPWTKDQDSALIALVKIDTSLGEISTVLKRQKGAIRSRINKLMSEGKF